MDVPSSSGPAAVEMLPLDPFATANAVISNAHDHDTHHPDATSEELVTLFSRTLLAAALTISSESQDVFMQATRLALAAADEQQRYSLIPSFLPLLISPSICIRHHAAASLLDIYSTPMVTGITPLPHLPALFSALSRSFSPNTKLAPPYTPSSLLFLRYVSTILRVLSDVITRLSAAPIKADTVDGIISLLVLWIYPRSAAPSTGSSLLARPGAATMVGGAFSFGASSSVTISPKKNPPTRRIAASSETETRETEEEAEMETKRTMSRIRAAALGCLKSLAATNPKQLYVHWSSFLADSAYVRSRRTLLYLMEHDTSLSVRILACTTLERMLNRSIAYLTIADDRPTKASFISLSNRLGEIVSQLHLKLGALIALPCSRISPQFIISLLKLGSTLGRNSPYGRMHRALASPLCDAILPLTRSSDDLVAIAAIRSLSIILQASFSYPTAPSVDIASLSESCEASMRKGASDQVVIAMWSLLAIVSSRMSASSITSLLILLESKFDSTASAAQEPQVNFISSLFLVTSLPSPALSASKQLLLRISRSASRSESAACRAVACTLLANPIFVDLDPAEEHQLDASSHNAWNEALLLVKDEDWIVRAAALRALGLRVKTGGVANGMDRKKARSIVRLCIRYCGESSESGVRISASWTLANCCDRLEFDDIIDMIAVDGAQLILNLAATNDEKIQTNAFRILGHLCRHSAPSVELESVDVKLLNALLEGLDSLIPKVRWNAAAAIANAFGASQVSARAITMRVRTSLVKSIAEDANLKVRIQATSALAVITVAEEERGVLACELRVIREALNGMTVVASEAEHKSQLDEKLQSCIRYLSQAS